MNNIRNILIGLGLGVASLVAIDRTFNETLVLTDVVMPATMKPLIEELHNDGDLLSSLIRETLIIDSPGGSVQAGNALINHLHYSGRHVTTKIYDFAASMGALLFLAGQDRLMAPSAKILFHEIRVQLGNPFRGGVYMVTLTDLKAILKGEALPDNSSNKGQEELVVKLVQQQIGSKLQEVVNDLEAEESDSITYIAKRINRTEEFVRKNIVRPNEDLTFTAEEAIKLGIATGIA